MVALVAIVQGAMLVALVTCGVGAVGLAYFVKRKSRIRFGAANLKVLEVCRFSLHADRLEVCRYGAAFITSASSVVEI